MWSHDLDLAKRLNRGQRRAHTRYGQRLESYRAARRARIEREARTLRHRRLAQLRGVLASLFW